MSDKRKFVIFDLDGTLIDSYECVLRCVNKVLARKAMKTIEAEKESIGCLFNRVSRMDIGLSPDRFKELFDQEHIKDIKGINLIPSSYKLLHLFYENGIRIIILTNKRQHIAELICKRILGSIYENLIIIGRDGITPLKAFPDKVRNKIAERNYSINDCIGYYGDSVRDCQLSNKLEIPFIKL